MSRKTIFSLFLVILGGFTLLLLLTKVYGITLLQVVVTFVGRSHAS